MFPWLKDDAAPRTDALNQPVPAAQQAAPLSQFTAAAQIEDAVLARYRREEAASRAEADRLRARHQQAQQGESLPACAHASLRPPAWPRRPPGRGLLRSCVPVPR